jgi:phage terminase large subunit
MKSRAVFKRAAEHFLDPVKFAHEIQRHETWSVQDEILRAIRDYPRVAVKGCHGSSKTFAIAEAVLWFLARWPDGVVVTTGPSWTQVKEIVWREIHKAAARSVFPYPSPHQTELRLTTGAYAIGLSTDEAVRFQGFHGAHLLVIVDEAPGLRGDIWEAIEGARAGGDVHVVALGNPTMAGGVFYDAFTSNRANWKTFTIDAFATPNLEGFTLEQLRQLPPDLPDDAEIFRYCPRPYLVTRRWVYERFWEWGEKSLHWEARVRGEFPTQAEDALISLAWLGAAQGRGATDGGGKVQAGIDVAEAGEAETVLVVREGPTLLKLKTWSGIDARGVVAAELAPYRQRLETVNVDAIGVGAYFAKHLKDLGFPVRSIRVSEKSRHPERFVNLKAQLYWGLRERFEAGDVAGLKDEQTISQLATIRYFYNPRGQLHIESKEDARKRGIKSPDRAEAMMLAYAGRSGSGYYELMRQRYEESQNAAAQTAADDPAARAEAATANLVKEHSAGHFIDIDPEYYKSYIRPRLRASADPAAAALATELDRRFGLAGSSR